MRQVGCQHLLRTDQRGSTYTGTACDPDTTECTWSLQGPDAGDFEIDNQTGRPPSAQLTFKEVGGPNYEMPADANGDNVYMVTVVVTDVGIDGQGKLSAERDVVVTVTNVEEGTSATVVTLSSLAAQGRRSVDCDAHRP